MAKWQNIRNATGMRLHTVADLLMDGGHHWKEKTIPVSVKNPAPVSDGGE